MIERAIGVDIGGTKILVGAVDAHGRVGARIMASTPSDDGPEAIGRLVAGLIEEVRTEEFADAPIGVGAAGVIAPDGSIADATRAIRHWRGFPLGEFLRGSVRAPVSVVNDVHAAAIGETQFGAGVGYSSLLMVTVGTGVGGALVMDGTLIPGRTGSAGSVGHLQLAGRSVLACPCGGACHVEAYASGPAMESSFSALTGEAAALREIAERARRGEPLARAVLSDGAQALGCGLSSALSLLDVEAVVIGGGVASIGDLYLDDVRRAFRASARAVFRGTPIVPAALRDDATVVGAARLAMDSSPAR